MYSLHTFLYSLVCTLILEFPTLLLPIHDCQLFPCDLFRDEKNRSPKKQIPSRTRTKSIVRKAVVIFKSIDLGLELQLEIIDRGGGFIDELVFIFDLWSFESLDLGLSFDSSN